MSSPDESPRGATLGSRGSGWRGSRLGVAVVVGVLLALGLVGAWARAPEAALAAPLASSGWPGDGDSDGGVVSADGRFVAFWSDASNLVRADTNFWVDSQDGHRYGADDVFVRDLRSGRTERVSVSSAGRQANGSSSGVAISADGRYVAFSSDASNLVADDRQRCYDDNGSHSCADVFVRDRLARKTERVSLSSSGAQPAADSYLDGISADGRFVVFHTGADLVPGGANEAYDVYLRDRLFGKTEIVSVSTSGAPGNADSGGLGRAAAISADGRFVAFESDASNLVGGDTNECLSFEERMNCTDVFVRDRLMASTERVSVSSAGAQGNGPSFVGAISANGRFVAFYSGASNLVPGDTTGQNDPGEWGPWDVFVRDRVAATTERVNISSTGAQANKGSPSWWGTTALSADGRFVAFPADASNLVPGDTNGTTDVFLRDRKAGTTERVSVANSGGQGNWFSYLGGISADARVVAFPSFAANLVAGDTRNCGNGDVFGNCRDVFVRDRTARTTTLISMDAQGRRLLDRCGFNPGRPGPVSSSPPRRACPATTP